MRRPRKKLEVSTFPFLAVLLCIMGSLMLLLFIMDRRAKIAAKYRVEEELQVRQKRTKEEEDKRQAEWEKARQNLHTSLQQQADRLLADSKGVQHNLSDAGNKVALIQARHLGLEDKVKDESTKIGALYLEIEAQRAGLQQADKKEHLSKAELIEAAKELAELERAFQQLRALRERDKQVYSVVPYRGKRGDMRPPIYVECVGDGVVFHPEKKSLHGWEFSPGGVRGEVEKRFGPLAIQKSAPDKDAAKGPYVLFLVRPSGIGSYYKAQSALKGFEVDFGYELVDEGWALDFSGETHAKNGPPSRPGVPWKHGEEPRPMFVSPPPGSGSIGPPQIAIQSPGGFVGVTPGVGSGKGGVPIMTVPGGSGLGSALPPPPSGSGLSNVLPSPPAGSGVGSVLPSPPAGSGLGSGLQPPPAGSGSGNALPSPPAGSGLGSGLPPPSGGSPSNPGVDTGVPVKPPAFVPIAKGTPTGNSGSPGVKSNGTSIPGNGGAGQGSTSPTQPGSASGESNGKAPIPFGADPTKKPPPASPLSKLLGNKDFLITVDCRKDAVTINPSGLIYRWTASNVSETDAALVQTVTNLISRRQASVRQGEPPYRPLICFRVSSDGLRTYLRVYPLLERLNVTMTRENVED